MKTLPPKKGMIENSINTLLIDGNALFKTGYHGAKDEFNANGQHIGGVYQFITMLRKLLNEEFYHKVFVFWDGKFSGKLRFEIYKDYKGDRNKDFINGTAPVDENQLIERYMVQEYLEELSIKQLEDEVVEGDDFIAFYCKTKEDNENITICSNDGDLCQLLEENIRIYLLHKKNYINLNNYQEYFSHKQENSMLIKIIAGDSSDTIKGIKGVKEKTLLNLFPELADKKVELPEILEKASFLQDERIKNKLKKLGALENILNRVTVGCQGKDIYEINNRLVNLSVPLMTETAINNLVELRNNRLSVDDRGIKNVYNLMKRDGIDKKISNFSDDYLLPFKKLIEREKKNKYEQQ